MTRHRVILAAILAPAVLFLSAPARPRAQSSHDVAEYPRYDYSAANFIQRGQAARALSQLLASDPDNVDLPRLLASRQRQEDSLSALRRIVERHPDWIAAALQNFPSYDFTRPQADNRAAALAAILAAARARLPELPRNDAAAAARLLLTHEWQLVRGGRRIDSAAELRALADEYKDTDAGLLIAVDAIVAEPNTQSRLDAFDAFVSAHPGTVAAAKALHQKGVALRNPLPRAEPPGADPTRRFNQAVEIMRRLQGGEFPRCEWVDDAPALVAQFPIFSNAVRNMSDANAAAMLETFHRLVRKTMPDHAGKLATSSIPYVVQSKMGELLARRGDRIAEVENVYDALAREAGNPTEVRYVRALYLLTYLVEPAPDREVVMARAAASLRALHTEGVQPYARRALATLASMHFFQRQYAAARRVYAEYLRLYPSSDWAWLANVRAGQAAEALDDVQGAARAYAAAAASPSALPAARVVAFAHAADALAELGDSSAAARGMERALAHWDDEFGETYATQASQAAIGPNPLEREERIPLSKALIRTRLAELRVSSRAAGGTSLERARRMIARGKDATAIPLSQRAAREARGTALEPIARTHLHRAELNMALKRADVESADANPAEALRLLEVLDAAPIDFHVFAARMARATMLSRRPETAAQADTAMSDALAEWQRRQPQSPPPDPNTLEGDVAAIRAEVFRPLGGGIYQGRGWNAFRWPTQLPRFIVANPDVRVKLPGAAAHAVTLRSPVPGFDSIIFMNRDELAVLTRMITALGGTRREQPTTVMQTPNQPAGSSVSIQSFWNRYFPMRAGHWSGWEFETYPSITEIGFLDAERTRAAVRVTVGFSGATIMLAKENGRWLPTALVDVWVT